MNKFVIKDLNLTYSDGVQALKNINLEIPANEITVLFGPAGGGKSSFLRTLNRLNDLADVAEVRGSVLYDGEEILGPKLDVISLRRKIGMVFARPVVLPMSIRQNMTYALELAGVKNSRQTAEAVDRGLRQAAIWEEVKDRLDDPAVALSGGQQQRLCLARVLAMEPDVILLDEPTSGLDPISTGRIEQTLQDLKEDYTIVIVPQSVQQAARISDFAGFFLQGELIETGWGKDLFIRPKNNKTEDYVEGRFG